MIGIYLFDAQVFRIVKTLKPSDRGELEITDVNNAYIKMKTMTWEMLEGWWTDAGTFESLMRAALLVSDRRQQLVKIVFSFQSRSESMAYAGSAKSRANANTDLHSRWIPRRAEAWASRRTWRYLEKNRLKGNEGRRLKASVKEGS